MFTFPSALYLLLPISKIFFNLRKSFHIDLKFVEIIITFVHFVVTIFLK